MADRPFRPTPKMLPGPLRQAESGPSTDTRQLRAPPPFQGPAAVEQRLVLFACAADRARARELLQGLSTSLRSRALAHLERLLSMPSSDRHGHLAREFGTRPTATAGLRALWAHASPPLRAEIYRLLPPYHRSLFLDHVPEEERPVDLPPGLCAFAARLVHEATR